MIDFVLNVVLGLFIWMLLPILIYGKKKYNKNTPQFFLYLVCKIVGICVIVFSALRFIRDILN
jgi:hypothetical protein